MKNALDIIYNKAKEMEEIGNIEAYEALMFAFVVVKGEMLKQSEFEKALDILARAVERHENED